MWHRQPKPNWEVFCAFKWNKEVGQRKSRLLLNWILINKTQENLQSSWRKPFIWPCLCTLRVFRVGVVWQSSEGSPWLSAKLNPKPVKLSLRFTFTSPFYCIMMQKVQSSKGFAIRPMSGVIQLELRKWTLFLFNPLGHSNSWDFHGFVILLHQYPLHLVFLEQLRDRRMDAENSYWSVLKSA